MKIYKFNLPNQITMKGETTINGTPLFLVKFLSDLQKRKEWDASFEDRKMVLLVKEGPEEGNKIFLSHMKFKPPSSVVTARDFATISGSQYDKNTQKAIVYSKSTKSSLIPETSAFVRGETLSGYFIEPSRQDPSKSNVVYIVQLDPKGWLPGAIKTKVAQEQPMTLVKMRDFIAKSKL